ncbi:arginase family protein [Dongia deserti]|uniref:arginase family protein n=1 Tax=Dongia deserti TaxID=2268030 RepID=UPI0013C452AF|nr:arginase family protein [Dongia deserti]
MLWNLAGVSIDSAGVVGGTELAPSALRRYSRLQQLVTTDLGDVAAPVHDRPRDPRSGLVGHRELVAATEAVRKAFGSWLDPNRRLAVIGGCCTLMIGLGAATRDRLGRFGIAYIDGHLDLYDGQSSPWGEGADVPVATMLGHGDPEILEAAGGCSLAPEHVYLLGYRDGFQAGGHGSLMPEDFSADFRHVDTAGIRAKGPINVGEAARAHFEPLGLPFWLFLDVDALDPVVFPATDAPIGDGLDWDEIEALAGPLARSPRLLGVVTTCYNPEKDPDGACGRRLGQFLEGVVEGNP